MGRGVELASFSGFLDIQHYMPARLFGKPVVLVKKRYKNGFDTSTDALYNPATSKTARKASVATASAPITQLLARFPTSLAGMVLPLRKSRGSCLSLCATPARSTTPEGVAYRPTRYLGALSQLMAARTADL